MAEVTFSLTVKQIVRINAFQGQEVSLSMHGFTPDMDDDQLQKLVTGAPARAFKHLSDAVLEKCNTLRSRAIDQMKDETL